MKNIIILLILLSGALTAQNYKVEKVNGIVKAQIGSSEEWVDVKEGLFLKSNTLLSTEENSSVILSNGELKFTLKESSALPVGSIKKLTLDELLLALAMEDMINAPKKKNDSKTKNTAVYGTEEKEKKEAVILDDDFGIKRLNGAKQLAESGYKESAVVNAKETYRKYPETKDNVSYRIYFADILYNAGLYEEAYEEFTSIKSLKMNDKEKKVVNDKLMQLNKKLSN